MLNSLRFKILFGFIAIVVFTVGTILFFVQRETNATMEGVHDVYAKSLLETVVLNVENQYNSIQFHKETLLDVRKAELKNSVGLTWAILENFYQQQKKKVFCLRRRPRRWLPKRFAGCDIPKVSVISGSMIYPGLSPIC